MNCEKIKKLRGRNAGVIKTESCRESSVCVPIIKDGEEIRLLFEVRSPKIKTQPGDICFPGGRLEEGEAPQETALREICEELLINPQQVNVICPLDIFCDGCLMIHPYLAELDDYCGSFSGDEVSEVFTVPLTGFLEKQPQRHALELVHLKSESFPYHLINGGEEYHFRRRFDDELFYVCKDSEGRERVIWGITARIIKSLADLLTTGDE